LAQERLEAKKTEVCALLAIEKTNIEGTPMPLIANLVGANGNTAGQKLIVYLPFEGGQLSLEIPASNIRSYSDDYPHQKWELLLRAIDALRAEIPSL
jgi:hypothetical protein